MKKDFSENEQTAAPGGEPTAAADSPPAGQFKEWALVELFGHNRIVGLVSEATLAGGAFLRVDVPAFNGEKAFTRFYRPEAICSLGPISEEIARGLMAVHRNEPVSRYEFPQIAEKVSEAGEEA